MQWLWLWLYFTCTAPVISEGLLMIHCQAGEKSTPALTLKDIGWLQGSILLHPFSEYWKDLLNQAEFTQASTDWISISDYEFPWVILFSIKIAAFPPWFINYFYSKLYLTDTIKDSSYLQAQRSGPASSCMVRTAQQHNVLFLSTFCTL